jgi:hypothetical protein
MKEKINIADILKDKPVGLKFYSNTFGYISFNGVHKDKVYFFSEDTNAHSVKPNGKMYDGGECIIFPSKEMRDWEKFSWKKGDVLYSAGLKEYCVFNKFISDGYLMFISNYNVDENTKRVVPKTYDPDKNTVNYEKVSDEKATKIISLIEEHYGGKLNLSTLEIEKQPEFKDGDIVFMKGIKGGYYANCIFILRSEYKDGDERAFYYAFYNTDDKFTRAEYGNTRVHYSLRPATDSEKQQLFDALAKKGKTWDAEKKQIVDLKPKCEFKPFDKVLGRNEKDDVWEAELFSHYKEESQYPFRCIGFSRKYCIPYNEETAHLLGTTDDWKGGEQ